IASGWRRGPMSLGRERGGGERLVRVARLAGARLLGQLQERAGVELERRAGARGALLTADVLAVVQQPGRLDGRGERERRRNRTVIVAVIVRRLLEGAV